MKFTADGIAGLAGQFTDFVVTELLVSHEEEQKAVFLWQRVEGFLDALAEFLGFEDSQRALSSSGRSFPDGFVVGAVDVTPMPGLQEILAVIDGDAVEPSADAGVAREIAELAVGLEEDVVSGVLCLRRIAQHAEGQVKDGAGMLLVDRVKLGRFETDSFTDRRTARCRWHGLRRLFGHEG